MFTIDRIIAHGVNLDHRYRYAKYNEVIYRVMWYGHKADDDSSKPILHLSRRKVLSYARKAKIPIPTIIDDAIDS